jgi:hypothetical protein
MARCSAIVRSIAPPSVIPRQIRARIVERDVVVDELLDGVAARHPLEQGAQLRDLLVGDPLRRQQRRLALEHAPRLEQVQEAALVVEVDHEGQRVEQQRRVEAGDVGAVALAHVEDPDEAQRPHRLAQRAAREPEPLRQVRLPRQPVARPQLAGHDHAADPLDGDVGDAHFTCLRMTYISSMASLL